MKAHPPVTAEPSSYGRTEQARPSRFVQTMRRVAIGAAGLAVAVLAAAACVLSFDDLRALAMQAGARANFAYLYPAAFDALLVIALLSFMLLSSARPLVRLQAGFVLFILLVAASWANVSMAMRFTIDARLGAVIVGVVPWVMLLIGLWLLTLLIKHAQVRRAAYEAVERTGPRDIVPFDGTGTDSPEADTAEHPRPDFARPGSVPVSFEPIEPSEPLSSPRADTTPSPAPTVPGPAVSPGERLGVDHEPPVPAPATRPGPVTTSTPTPPPPAPPAPDTAGEADSGGPGGQGEANLAGEEGHAEVSRSSASPVAESEGRRFADAPDEASTTSASAVDTPLHGERDDVEAVAATSQGEAVTASGEESGRPKRPIQWGDLLRPPQGDVLVHPRSGQKADAEHAAGRAEDLGQASGPVRETSRAEETDWEPEETEAGPAETDASSDEAEAQVGTETVEGGVPVWPPDAIDTRPNVAMSPGESPPEETHQDESESVRDTQPYPHLRDQSEPLGSPDPAHGAGDADPGEFAEANVPASGGPTVPLAPPSGRMRSTPVPPQD